MAAKALEEALERVANWPEEAQRELAEIALEIDAELSGGVYHATADELEGIDRGLKEAREGRFASEGGLRETAAGMKVVYTQEALADLDAILEFISSHYPGVYAAFERRIQALRRALAHGRRAPRRSSERTAVRVVPLIRYPYKTFCWIENDIVEVLYVHHAARRPPWEADG